MTLIERDLKSVWHPFTQAKIADAPLPIVKAEGVYLFDEDGKKYLDGNSSWWTILHGHCHPYMVGKIHEQLQTLDHSIFAGSTHPKAVEAAEKVLDALPGDFSKIFFSDNGSTAVEVAIKMICQYWYNKGIDKKKFLALEGAYHGDTFGAMSVGARGYFNKPFEPFFFDVDYLAFPTDENYQEVLADANAKMSTGEYAGFIFEPLVQGAAGMRIYDAEVLNELVKMAKENDVLTIADEVMTGFYRTGELFSIGHIEEEVDFVAMSKGLTGGVMAMGMTATKEFIYEAFLDDKIDKAFLHGHSFTANPIACSAVCASLDLLTAPEMRSKIDSISESHQAFCEKLSQHPHFRSAKSLGTILSLEVEVGEESSYFSSIRADAVRYFLDNGILLRPLGNILYVNAPYVITQEEMNFLYDHIVKFVEDWKA